MTVPSAKSLILLLVLVIVGCNTNNLSVCTAFQLSRSSTRPHSGTTSRSSASRIILASSSNSNTNNKVVKSDDEWKQTLSPEAYYVLREAGTERPNSSELNDVHDAGTFVCRGCGAPLFTMAAKFESGSGWPSFFQPIDRTAVDLKMDFKLLLPRTEVTCAACAGHLGHVFEDGPEPTGQRYCMNGVSMTFSSDEKNPELAAAVLERQTTPFQPSVGSQVSGILLNGGIGGIFFASFVSRIADIDAMGSSPTWFDFLPILPAIFYGMLAVRGVARVL